MSAGKYCPFKLLYDKAKIYDETEVTLLKEVSDFLGSKPKKVLSVIIVSVDPEIAIFR